MKAELQLDHQGPFGKKKKRKNPHFSTQKMPMSNKVSILTGVQVMFKVIKPLTLPLKKQQKSLISGKGGGERLMFSWFLGSL